jgi:hypothetical protein
VSVPLGDRLGRCSGTDLFGALVGSRAVKDDGSEMVQNPISTWRTAAIGLGAAVWCCAISSLVAAQTYKQIDRAIVDARKAAQLRRDVSTIVRSPTPLAASDRTTLTDFYVLHIVAGMTRPEALDDPQRIPGWRRTVLGDLNSSSISREKHDAIRDLVFRAAEQLVQDRGYSPYCRYNALLMIGDLNEREMQISGRTVTPAVPYAPARESLLKVVESDDAQEMKIGALVGLARHARLAAAAGGNPDARLLKPFVDVLKQKEPAAGESADGLLWAQRIAIDALGDIGLPGAVQLLEPILSDVTAPMLLRCTAADALGRLDFGQPGGNAGNVDHAALLKALRQVAVAALNEQIQMLHQHLQENPSESLSPEGRLRGENSQDVPEDPLVQRVRRQLKYQLVCVGRGLQAVASAPDAETKNAVTALRSEIGAIVKELDDKSLMPQALYDKILTPASRLESALSRA